MRSTNAERQQLTFDYRCVRDRGRRLFARASGCGDVFQTVVPAWTPSISGATPARDGRVTKNDHFTEAEARRIFPDAECADGSEVVAEEGGQVGWGFALGLVRRDGSVERRGQLANAHTVLRKCKFLVGFYEG